MPFVQYDRAKWNYAAGSRAGQAGSRAGAEVAGRGRRGGGRL